METIEKKVPATYQLVLECFRSGQMEPSVFNLHLEDPHFKAWYEKQR